MNASTDLINARERIHHGDTESAERRKTGEEDRQGGPQRNTDICGSGEVVFKALLLLFLSLVFLLSLFCPLRVLRASVVNFCLLPCGDNYLRSSAIQTKKWPYPR